LKFKDSNLEYEWSYREVMKRKWDSTIGLGFYFLMTLVTDFPAIEILSWTNENWYPAAAYTRWGLVAMMFVCWILIYSKPIDYNTAINPFSEESNAGH
jgi:hypothetical protein